MIKKEEKSNFWFKRKCVSHVAHIHPNYPPYTCIKKLFYLYPTFIGIISIGVATVEAVTFDFCSLFSSLWWPTGCEGNMVGTELGFSLLQKKTPGGKKSLSWKCLEHRTSDKPGHHSFWGWSIYPLFIACIQLDLRTSSLGNLPHATHKWKW